MEKEAQIRPMTDEHKKKKGMKKTVGQDKLNNNSSLLDNSLEVYFTNLEKTQVYDCSNS